MALSQDLLTQALPSWRALLQSWSQDGSLLTAARQALQLSGTPEALGQLIDQWSAGDFSSLPPIELLSSSDISGARGAYAISTGTIYLDADWLQSASQEQLNAVLTEELGHHLDGLLNVVDTKGDEGEVFADLLFGTTPNSTASQNDAITIIVNGQSVAAEASGESLPFSIDPWLDNQTYITDIIIDATYQVYVQYWSVSAANGENGTRDLSGGIPLSRSFSLKESNEIWRQFVGDDNLDLMESIRSYAFQYESINSTSLAGDRDGINFNLTGIIGKVEKGTPYSLRDNIYVEPVDNIGGFFLATVYGDKDSGAAGALLCAKDFVSDGTGFQLYGDSELSPYNLTSDQVFVQSRNDILHGSDYDDDLMGLLGDDTCFAGNGADMAYGGYGRDSLLGGDGNDELYGEAGNDSLYGEAGDDFLDGGPGADFMCGGTGNDIYIVDNVGDVIQDNGDATDVDYVYIPVYLNYTLPEGFTGVVLQGTANSSVVGNAGNNAIYGNAGNNSITAGDGDDYVDAGSGADVLVGGTGRGNDEYNGGDGIDTLVYTSATSGIVINLRTGKASGTEIDQDTLYNVENLILGTGNDDATGDQKDNRFDGGTAAGDNDILRFSGAFAEYTTTTNAQTNTFVVSDKVPNRDGTDTATGFEQFVFADGTYFFSTSLNQLVPFRPSLASVEASRIALDFPVPIKANAVPLTSFTVETVSSTGAISKQTIKSISVDANTASRLWIELNAAPASTVDVRVSYSDPANDQSGGVVESLNGADLPSFSNQLATVFSSSSSVTALASQYLTLHLKGSSAINGTGNAAANTLNGNGAANLLSGLAGADTINGNGGKDTAVGGLGADLLTGGADADTFRFVLTDSLLPAFDRITDFTIGSDSIDGPSAVTAASLRENAGSVAALSESAIAAVLTTTSFAKNGAATFSYSDPINGPRTFLALNNGTAGFLANADAIIEITGFSGDLSLLAVV